MTKLFRNAVQKMAGYVPGEQPQSDGWIKLNTNENPYPPSPKVVEAIQQAATGRLNIYPDPLARSFREAAAELFDVTPDWILPANGSDENLTILIRSFCDPGQKIVYPYPSYVLYESLAQIQDCVVKRLKLNPDLQWNQNEAAAVTKDAKLCFVPNPNSPTGNLWTSQQLAQLIPSNGLLVLDEAYGDFADTPHRAQLLHEPEFSGRTIITRTLSKSYSLAGIRFGFSIADPALTSGMHKVKDSYNCDTIAIAAATAAIRDQDWMLKNRSMIQQTRSRLAAELPALGFHVFPSQANFLWTSHETGRHKELYERLKEKKILVRYMVFPDAQPNGETLDGLRITIGTDSEIDRLLEALQTIVPSIA